MIEGKTRHKQLCCSEKKLRVADLQIALHHDEVHLVCDVCFCVSVKIVDLETTLKLYCSCVQVWQLKRTAMRPM